MDDADRAQEVMEHREMLALQHRATVAPVGLQSADCCEECGELIHSARQLAVPGTQHCPECAEYYELRARHGR